ncbi:MAG: hypothetical protein ACRC62_20470 [Microcoleus sp.]
MITYVSGDRIPEEKRDRRFCNSASSWERRNVGVLWVASKIHAQ